MSKKTFQIVALIAAVAVLATFAAIYSNRENKVLSRLLGGDKPVQDDGKAIVGADAAAKREAGLAHAGKPGEPATDKAGFPVANYGTIQPITAAASPQTRSAVEAALSKTHPERLTCAIMPAKFDAKKWATDADYKAKYLQTPEPARCYQSAQPGRDIPRLALASPAYVVTLQLQPVELSVKATPGMPVTFTSFDAASFTSGSGNTGSHLTTQTCIADENGLATAALLAGPGVINDCRVIASCPVDAGLVRITVHAVLPAAQGSSVALGAPANSSTNR